MPLGLISLENIQDLAVRDALIPIIESQVAILTALQISADAIQAASPFVSFKPMQVGTVCGSLLQPDDVKPPWLVANGQAVSRTGYKPLWDAIGEQFGNGDGSTSFNLPDLRDKFWYGTPGAGPAGQTADKKPTATTTAVVGGGGALGVITVSAMNVFYLTPVILGR